MVIHKMTVRGWRSWTDFTLELQPRLNLIHGPNESGKSSLQEALLAALTQGSKPGGRHRLHSVKPWSASKNTATEVELAFHHGETEWVVKRVFFGKGCELRKQGRVVAKDAEVLTQLRDAIRNAGLSALLSNQGERNLAPLPAELRPLLTTAEALSPGLPWLEGELQKLNEQYWTANRRDPRERLKDAREAALAAETALGGLRRKLEEVDRASLEIGHLELDLEVLRTREQELEARLQREQDVLDTESRELARHVQELETWQQRHQRHQEQLALELTRQQTHDEQVAALREKMGPVPDRSEIEGLQHRLRYCEAWLGALLTRTLAELRAPEPEALQALENLLDRRTHLAELLERLQHLATAQAELERVHQDASSSQSTLAELEQQLETQRQRVEKHQAERERQAEMKREVDRLASLSRQWTEQSQSVLSLHEAQESYLTELRESERTLGEAPSRQELDRLRELVRCCQLQAWHTEREQLRHEPQPDPKILEELEERLKRLREARELLEQSPADLAQLEREVEELKTAAALATQRKERADELKPLEESVERWQRLMPTLRARHQESLDYADRLDKLKAKMGEKPNRQLADDLRARVRAVEAREQQLRQQEIESLKAPARATLDEADVEVKTRQTALEMAQKSGAARRPVAAVVGLVVGLALGFALKAAIAAVIGAVVGAALGFFLGGTAGSVGAAQAAMEESVARLQALLAEHGLDSVEAGRARLDRRAALEGGLRSLPVPEVMPADVASMAKAEVERELADLPARLEAAEAQLREAGERYSEHEQAYEALLQTNPEASLNACREQLLAVADTFPPQFRPEIPRVGDDGELASAQARIEELRSGMAEEVDPQVGARLQEATERLQTLRGESKGRLKTIRAKLALEKDLPVEEVAARQAELEERLQTLLAQFGITGSAEARERVASVRTRLKALDREKYTEADLESADLTELQGLDLTALRELLNTTEGEVERAEEAWKGALAAYQERRKAHDALLAGTREGALNQALEQLRKLGLPLPQDTWLEALRSGEASLGLERQQKDLAVRLDALSARLTAEDPRPHYEELQKTLAEATSENTRKAKGQGNQTGQVERQWDEVKRVAAGLGLEAATLGDLTTACQQELADADERSSRLFTEHGCDNLAELQQRVRRATELNARRESQPACPPGRLAELRALCPAPETVETLGDDALVRERQDVEAKAQRLEKEWERTNQSFARQQGELEQLLAVNPEEAVRTQRAELERLAEEHGDVAAVADKLEKAKARTEEIDRILKSDGRGETPYEQALTALKVVRTEAGELRSRADTLQGTIQSDKDIYHRMARAEEAYRRSFAEQRDVELEAGAVQMLNDYITAAKEAFEADLVGPLRGRIEAQLGRLTQGRYQGLELNQDFTAEQLVTPVDVKAPIGDLSVGTQEQLYFLSRVCLAQLLSEQERMMVVFDDNLVHTDGARLDIASEILLECAETCQVLLFTCHPERFGRLGDVAHRVELPSLVGA